MGNRSSVSTNSDNDGGSGSGMFLAPELQAKINSEFDAKILNEEWDKRHQQRETNEAIREAEVKQQMEALDVKAKAVHGRLDEMTDKIKSQLADLEVELEHDVDRLSAKFEGNVSRGAASCIDARAELNSCYTTLKDSAECQIFAKKLEKCVTEALA
ncbi:hypothetical protein THAOC_05377 [Thalassiosira oceanica]|uniref:Uncharacterized protein n=1 Tax=Thalassiosira oceanica TaxID=159749 RepID=K0TMV9_THAOC|nr:hypothetical protein THAOC_05377 [Thalassiosira oceanica]|eukprot:EJK73027.1 hypothetical protein THAOC_05377 [Thalassiosira oceanica]